MPFKSKAQRRYMYANYPKIAKRWSKHTPKNADLPEYVEECYVFNKAEIEDEEGIVTFDLENSPGAQLVLIYDIANSAGPDYISGYIKDPNATKQIRSFRDPEAAESIIGEYGLEVNDLENEIYQQGVEQLQAALEEDSLTFESLFDKIVNS